VRCYGSSAADSKSKEEYPSNLLKAVLEMKVGPSGSVFRNRSQTALKLAVSRAQLASIEGKVVEYTASTL